RIICFVEQPLDVFSFEETEDWLTRIQKLIPSAKFDFYAEIKMDGLAVSLIYKKGVLGIGSTRGDGQIGENVTQNLKTIEAIPLKIHEPKEKDIANFLHWCKQGGNDFHEKKMREFLKNPAELETRGECFMPKKVFEMINKEQERKGEALFANPRNAGAGAIRQLDSTVTASRHLDFYAYALMTDLGQTTHEQAHELLKLFGFKTNSHNKHCAGLGEIEKFHNFIMKERPKLPYWTDGVVVVINDNKNFDKLGVAGKAPRGMIAYKFPAEQATTMVEKVEWHVGRTGALTPVATMKPALIGGTTVTHATLHNFDEIERLGLKIGDTVIVAKAGDIIPKVIEVLSRLRTGKEKTIHPPSQCPICNADVKKEKSGAGESVAFFCSNKNCFAKEKEKIIHFVSRKAFDIDGLGEKIVEQLLNVGLIATPADIFTLKQGDLEPLARFAEKSAENLILAIAKAKNIILSKFLYALGIIHVGEQTAIDLANDFGSLEKIKEADLEKINGIPNIGEVVAKSIFNWFHNEKNLKLIDDLIKNGVKIKNPMKMSGAGKLKGLSFVFTGELDSMSRESAKEKVRALGGETPASVSKNTSYVVAGASPGSKYEKAKKLDLKILNENEFLEIIK
ncbi:MAG: NAD-dependent DNA ligase LigA, partial [Patescibacteria group bacterium]